MLLIVIINRLKFHNRMMVSLFFPARSTQCEVNDGYMWSMYLTKFPVHASRAIINIMLTYSENSASALAIATVVN